MVRACPSRNHVSLSLWRSIFGALRARVLRHWGVYNPCSIWLITFRSHMPAVVCTDGFPFFSSYSSTKFRSERMVLKASEKDFAVCALRIPMIFGERPAQQRGYTS